MESERAELPAVAAKGPPDMRLVGVPSRDEFQCMVADSTADQLRDLRNLVAAWLAVAEKCSAAKKEVVRLAIYRLQAERALGIALTQTVRRGGVGSKSRSATSKRGGASNGLPEGITKHQSHRYKALAAITDEVFAAYIAEAERDARTPTWAGVNKLARSTKPQPVRRKKRKSRSVSRSQVSLVVPSSVIDVVTRIMLPDVVVGDAAMPAKRRVSSANVGAISSLTGDVFISDCPEPAAWLPELRRLRDARAVAQIIVVLRAEVWADWFQLMPADGWSCCFLAGLRTKGGDGVVLAHQGEKQAAFCAAASNLGVFIR